MKSVLEYIPQQPPFVMVDKLLFCDNLQTQTTFLIKEDNLFVDNGVFTETGILENIAQTSAVRSGYLNKNQPVGLGVIGSVNNFEVFHLPKVGEQIETMITVEAEVFNVVLFSAKCICSDKTLATCTMKVVLTDTAVNF